MLTREEYCKTVRRPYPPLVDNFICNGYRNYREFRGVLRSRFSLRQMIKVKQVWYYSKAEMKRGGLLPYRDWMRPGRLAAVVHEFIRREHDLLKAARVSFTAYRQAFEHYMPAVALIWLTEVPLNANIRKFLGRKLGPEALERLMDDLNIPLKDNYYKREEYDLVHATDFVRHAARYEWLHSRYGELKPYTAAQAKAARKNIDRTKFLKDWTQTKARVRKSVALAKRLLPKAERPMVDLMQFIIYYRTQRTDVMNRSFYVLAPILKAMAAERGITYEQLIHCTVDEVLGQVPSTKLLDERMKGHVFTMENGTIRCLTGRDRLRYEAFFADAKNGATEVRGTVACRGRVSGTVRVIMSRDDFPKVKRGDVLVTSMTSPHMVPIMKIAGAIVTDEGGITCHAAIISRELKKPCVIGTSRASEIFKDGDRVDVDAESGIVRKAT